MDQSDAVRARKSSAEFRHYSGVTADNRCSTQAISGTYSQATGKTPLKAISACRSQAKGTRSARRAVTRRVGLAGVPAREGFSHAPRGRSQPRRRSKNPHFGRVCIRFVTLQRADVARRPAAFQPLEDLSRPLRAHLRHSSSGRTIPARNPQAGQRSTAGVRSIGWSALATRADGNPVAPKVAPNREASPITLGEASNA